MSVNKMNNPAHPISFMHKRANTVMGGNVKNKESMVSAKNSQRTNPQRSSTVRSPQKVEEEEI